MAGTVGDTYADRTIAAYRVHAQRAIWNWSRRARVSGLLRRFIRLVRPGGRVLDYGCGIGIDLAWIKKKGFQVEGLEGTLEFLTEARRQLPGVPLRFGRFETASLAAACYDGIWCNAALIHVPPRELAAQLKKLAKALKPGGLLGLTLTWGRIRRMIDRDWIPGRYVAAYTKPEAEAFFQGWDVRSLQVVSNDGRQGRWIQILAAARPELVEERIEEKSPE